MEFRLPWVSSNVTWKICCKNIPYVIVHVDDILVSGANDGDHLKNFAEVFTRRAKAGLG